MDELTTRRLAVIKQLYKMGIEQSYMPEPMNGFCLLSFHDSVEMFMKLCAESRDITVDRKTNFMDYFTLLPLLSDKPQMQNLNNKRVALKHHGSIPSNLDIEISRVNTTDFFENNTRNIFNIEFNEISLTWLIKYDSVKKYISLAEDKLLIGEYEEAIANSQFAFLELLYCYEENKIWRFNSALNICNTRRRIGTFEEGLCVEKKCNKKLRDYFINIDKSLSNLDNVTKVIGLGVNFKKYMRFKALSPYIQQWPRSDGNEYEYIHSEYIKSTLENSKFCINFVVDSALKVQDFDFEISELVNCV